MHINLWWRKHKTLVLSLSVLFLILFSIIRLVFVIDQYLKPTLSRIAEVKTKAMATNLINNTIHKEIK